MVVVWFHAVYLTLGSSPNITHNNTEILITAIGEGGVGGLPYLICHSDLTTCCRNIADNNGSGPLGQWTYPNGSVVLFVGFSATAGTQFYMSLRSSDWLVERLTTPSLQPGPTVVLYQLLEEI